MVQKIRSRGQQKDVADLGKAQRRAAENISRVEQLPYEGTKRLGLFVCLGRRQKQDGAEVYKTWQAVNKLNMELLFSHEPLEPGATGGSGGKQDQWTLKRIRQIHEQQGLFLITRWSLRRTPRYFTREEESPFNRPGSSVERRVSELHANSSSTVRTVEHQRSPPAAAARSRVPAQCQPADRHSWDVLGSRRAP
ncbi:hypothetical protein QYF61_010886 [Mycteria americana]|uniref:Uncharacterized protein n=1 Tax=Mycteria americana TaxID=33587 RepID=A0AAN7S4Y3_MYCAM|nr:hypothetical protein QYF61_010886 [Mycteria americana]